MCLHVIRISFKAACGFNRVLSLGKDSSTVKSSYYIAKSLELPMLPYWTSIVAISFHSISNYITEKVFPNHFIEVRLTGKMLCTFSVYNSVSLGTRIHPCNHHHQQGHRHNHPSTGVCFKNRDVTACHGVLYLQTSGKELQNTILISRLTLHTVVLVYPTG